MTWVAISGRAASQKTSTPIGHIVYFFRLPLDHVLFTMNHYFQLPPDNAQPLVLAVKNMVKTNRKSSPRKSKSKIAKIANPTTYNYDYYSRSARPLNLDAREKADTVTTKGSEHTATLTQPRLSLSSAFLGILRLSSWYAFYARFV